MGNNMTSGYDSPTSQAMKNSVILRGASGKGGTKKKHLYEGPAKPTEGRVQGVGPCARDDPGFLGYNGTLYLFGGDRYQMSYNDLYAYPISI